MALVLQSLQGARVCQGDQEVLAGVPEARTLCCIVRRQDLSQTLVTDSGDSEMVATVLAIRQSSAWTLTSSDTQG